MYMWFFLLLRLFYSPHGLEFDPMWVRSTILCDANQQSGQQYYVMQPTWLLKKKRILWFSLENAPLKISSLRIIRTRMHSCICSYNRICEDLCKSYHPRKKRISLVSKCLSLWYLNLYLFGLSLSLWADCMRPSVINIISPYIATGHRCCWSFPAICTIRHQYNIGVAYKSLFGN